MGINPVGTAGAEEESFHSIALGYGATSGAGRGALKLRYVDMLVVDLRM